jgi:alanyl-tRNA synthetase
MTPLKKYFKGEAVPPNKRAASCQKCIRTPDIENVGITARHGTFFEMLGNFSFGDYFKSDACKWAWEYFTEVLQIPQDLLWISVYEEDDEAFDVWTKEVGVPAERIVRFGKADNFWEHGSGPCGPCSEIYIDRGAAAGCSDNCVVGCECDRYIEVWNLVFTQFDSDGKGNYTPLANKNIDTGMGLERLACIMQGAANMFEVDTIKDVIKQIERISGRQYGNHGGTDVSIRVITDHVRSSTFMICDGVLPSNEGRGYVLRRLLRRAARHGRLIGIEKPFLYELCDKVIESSEGAYPELAQKSAYIKTTIKTEEESFAKTVEKGLELLDTEIGTRRDDCIDGSIVFRLHDTFGFPVDLTREILTEQGLTFDEEKFNELMKVQKETARANQAFKGGWDDSAGAKLAGLSSEFINEPTIRTKIIEIIETPENALFVLEKTPFYAESGGQVGDLGLIDNGRCIVRVVDTKKTPSGLAVCYCSEKSDMQAGDEVSASVDAVHRYYVTRNHTAAHLLHSALRAVLGEHVHQAGSLVDEDRCRFDFTHGQALTAEQIGIIEGFVNESILESIPVTSKEMNIDEAKDSGAIALFGEKYGDTVQVVKISNNIYDISTELCGGTHVRNTGQIGLFKIVSEASVASGVRRIEAVTGAGVLDLLAEKQEEVNAANEKLRAANQASSKEIARLNSIIANMQAKSATVDEVGEVDGIKLFTQKISGADANAIRQAGDRVGDAHRGVPFIVIIAGESNLFCICSKEAIAKGYNAGKIVGEIAAVTGGKGGGKPDSAMAGIGDVSKVDEALKKFANI